MYTQDEDYWDQWTPPEGSKRRVFVIGAAGAIGKRLVPRLVQSEFNVVALLHRTRLPPELESICTCEFGVDVRDIESLRLAFRKYAP